MIVTTDPETGELITREWTQEERDAHNQAVAEQEVINRPNAILARLKAIDDATIRPMRAGETERVAELEAEAQALREELAAL